MLQHLDDLRESPTVALTEYLIGKGRQIRVFDPLIDLYQVCGSSKGFLLSSLPHIRDLLVGGLKSLLDWSDYLVVTQRPAKFREIKESFEGERMDLTRIEFD